MLDKLLGTDPLLLKTELLPLDNLTSEVKLLGFYFSAHHCPPCKDFTPLFVEVYKELNQDTKQFEVLFCSGDRTKEVFEEYYSDMPWLAFPFRDARLGPLAQEFKVSGMPTLILVSTADGKVMNLNAVQKVTEEGPEAIIDYLSKAPVAKPKEKKQEIIFVTGNKKKLEEFQSIMSDELAHIYTVTAMSLDCNLILCLIIGCSG